MRSNLKTLLFEPIIPIALLIYYLCINMCDIKIISFILIFLMGIILYKTINYLKRYFENIFQISIILFDWFILDFINISTNNQFSFLQSSLLETVARNSLHLIV